MKKKLVIATDNYLPRWDGISRFLSEIIHRLAKSYDITVIAPNYGKTKQKGFKVVKIPLKNQVLGDFQPAKLQYYRIKKIIKDADIVFTQTIGPIGTSAIIAAKKLNKKTVAFTHSIEWELFPKAVSIPILKKFLYPFTKMVVRKLYNKCDLLIVPSSNIADMLKWEDITTDKKVVHLGVDTSKFTKGAKETAKKKLGLTRKNFVIGYHGRLGREKDLKTLLRAFIRIKHPDVKLLIVGEGAKDVEKLFRNKPNIIFPGQQDNVVPYIQAMDVYVLASLTETSSLSTLEAMSCEVPVIATKVGFVKDYIVDGENGLFFQTKQPFDLAKKLKLLVEDAGLRAKLAKNARKTIIQEFKWPITAKKIEKAINSL